MLVKATLPLVPLVALCQPQNVKGLLNPPGAVPSGDTMKYWTLRFATLVNLPKWE